jgi:hypothetical protein
MFLFSHILFFNGDSSYFTVENEQKSFCKMTANFLDLNVKLYTHQQNIGWLKETQNPNCKAESMMLSTAAGLNPEKNSLAR